TQVSDAGLAELNKCRRLVRLNLAATPVTEVGLMHLKGLPLKQLNLSGNTRITSAALEALAAIDSLETLDFDGTGVDDTGLKLIKGLKHLRVLHLDGTQVTVDGVVDLQKALPQLVI